MAIGNFYSVNYKNKAVRKIIQLLGTLDLHTHIRLKPLIKFFKNYFQAHSFTKIRILELGCGEGINAFEIYKLSQENNIYLDYTGIDCSHRAIKNANNTLSSFKNIKGKFYFRQEDAQDFLEKNSNLTFDIILLIDIIEHIKNPQILIKTSKNYLDKNGFFIVSTPTPLYPKIFGVKFHNKIGHLVDGFSITQLDKLFNEFKFYRVAHQYNTGLFANFGCWLYYNKLNFKNKYFNFLKKLILYPFRFLDFYNNPQVSCSHFAVYGKSNE